MLDFEAGFLWLSLWSLSDGNRHKILWQIVDIAVVFVTPVLNVAVRGISQWWLTESFVGSERRSSQFIALEVLSLLSNSIQSTLEQAST